ncbi:hypothetical protein pb186bvf_003409 [Paramecium bursaria]
MIRIIWYSHLIWKCHCQEITLEYNYKFISILILLILSGFYSGATQGLLSIDEITIKVKLKYGNNQEKNQGKENIKCDRKSSFLIIYSACGQFDRQ